ncbi:MAG: aminopeptidase [Candidatus Borkfalkiaceae bacterium]|nr:aminopeptidase [Clostridia bacterium]MDY6222940.1 aminopeptidase [Christensenellaceae bacterium]
MSKLAYKRTNVYETADEKTMKNIFAYAERYKEFIDKAKTEREACAYVAAEAEKQGYKPYEFGAKLKPGDKVYYNNRGKNIYLIRVGTGDVKKDGIRIVASHIDSPRLDLKQVPLYESDGVALAKTHYYGGIKKYQWTTIPLALHGAVILGDGSKKEVVIGEDENDPVFYISDLLPHLSQKQNTKTLAEAFSGEDLNIWLGNVPYTAAKEDGDKTVKENLLHILYAKYGIKEEDFLSAELSLVPAYKARDIGFDRALIGAYGHDDRVCSFPAYTALLDGESQDKTVMVVLADKEEIGSEGNTGMQCAVFTDLIDVIADSFGTTSAAIRARSKCLSADVNAAYDPNFKDVNEPMNSTYLSCGAGLTKFTGARGKSGSNDASAEFMAEVRKIFNDEGVIWQTGELGKVDQGGGGTVAKYIANRNIDTVDIGVAVISMHSPYEVISKADVYEMYLACKAFIK